MRRCNIGRQTLYAVFVAALIGGMPWGAAAAEKNQAPPATPVLTAPVREAYIAEQVSVIGTTEPIRQSTVASEVEGRVEKLHVTEGGFVQKGTPLASLASTETSLRLKAAKAGGQAIAARLMQAEKELQRVANLKTTNSVAAKQYDEAYFTVQTLSRELERNSAEVEQLDYELTRKTVQAPFAGFVSREHTQVGQWLPKGGAVVTLVDLGNILIKADLGEEDMVRLNPGNRATVVIGSLSERPLPAAIEVVLPQGNATARTFPVRVTLPNRDNAIKAGMEAVVTFDLGEKFKAILVSKDAIVPSGDQRLVYRVEQGQAFPVPVVISGYYGNDAVIAGALVPGDDVVVRGNERLRPGQPVQSQALGAD